MTYIGALSGGSSSSSSSSSSAIDFTGGISGLASGIDTDSIIQGLMESAQEPLIQLLQQRQITQWKQASYQRVDNTLNDLKSNLSSLQLQSTFLQTTTSSSNSSLVSATSNIQSPSGSYSVKTYQLASGATVSSSKTLSTSSSYADTPLAQLSSSFGQSTSESFTLNGQTFTFNPQTATINTILQQINSEPSAGVSGFYDTNTGKVVLQTTSTGTGAKIEVSNDTAGLFSNVFGLAQTNAAGSASQPMVIDASYTTQNGEDVSTQDGTVDINGTKFAFTAGQSFSEIASLITAQSSQTGVSATYDATNHQLDLFGATTASQTLNFSQMPSAGDVLNVDGKTIAFYDSTTGTKPTADYTIDLSSVTTPEDVASAVASDIGSDTTLENELSATVANGTSVILNAKSYGSSGNFTTQYTPSNATVTFGAETLGTSGTSGTPTTQNITFSSVPAAGDSMTIAGQTIQFYDSSTESAPTGTGVTAIDVNNQTPSGIATAVAEALSGGATGTANGNVVTATATSNGSQSLDITYEYASAPVSGTGATNVQDTQLYSGIAVTDPTVDPTKTSVTDTMLGTIESTGLPASVQTGSDAYYSVNGYVTSSQTNQATYNNITFNLNGVTGPSSSVNVTVSSNTDAIVQAITSFVQQYNETLQYMQGQYNTKRNYDYAPLTQAQASQMTDTQITEWNQKAQAGMLENDQLLGSVMNNLKNVVSSTVPGQPTVNINGQQTTLNSLASIGISPIDVMNGVSSGATAPGVTTSGYNTYGLLQINTAQLQAAVEADPTAVMNLFTASGTGIAKQLYTTTSNSITQIQQQAGTGDTYDPTGPNATTTSSSSSSTTDDSSLLAYTLIDPNADFTTLFSLDPMNTSFLGEQVSTMDSQATSMNQQLQQLQQRYQTEYANMESAIEAVNSQSSYLVSMMGGSSS
ncbi:MULTISPECIES: flagellar filament capping protein FliD [Alicyclobacillus]|uniref:Filament cap protein n=1 Tax=Alicyclobacillus acidoterrestris (strain ATCC 49025 / DSM 3922 / CIP 106132 / NCIMB 13137 / GD3B) TaxID=1356854 RepID=T0BRE7_ALIAG|nr:MULTISPECIES: flagellar filament capping protein FliD [Alicyclobacillus]EPZ43364.1 hypothetical protein N007_13150 [Alicyclobacillus acidoterrestris ATCC 49025]UNO48799.1 flagellar filament capping protein FliD [Alicyclobacillus acidoterrestris]